MQQVGSDRRPIVVGVDGSPQSEAGLAWAVARAALTGGTVEALMAVAVPAIVYAAPVLVATPLPDPGVARAQLDAAVARSTAAHPDVKVSTTVAEAVPTLALVEAARHAELLVVGRSGHGALERAALGSVSDYCVRHASCPVALIGTSREEVPQ